MKTSRLICLMLCLTLGLYAFGTAFAEEEAGKASRSAISFDMETQQVTETPLSDEEIAPGTEIDGVPLGEAVDEIQGYSMPEDEVAEEDALEAQMNNQLLCYSIFGSDDRQILRSERETYPYRTVVYLEMTFPAGNYRGTGFMIGPHYVLTCGHCVYDSSLGGWATSIKVSPARSRNLYPYGSTYSTWLSCMSEWYYNHDWTCDLGLIKTSTDIGNTTGWLGYHTPTDAECSNYAWYIGYGQGTDYMYEATGYLQGTAYNGDSLKYRIDTLPGSSGSPVFIWYNNSNAYFIGVNNMHDDSYNYAVRLRTDTVNFFRDYFGK